MAKRTRTARAEIGIIGGSGLYDIEGLQQVKRVTVPTPFGSPSSPVVLGELDGFVSHSSRGMAADIGSILPRSTIARISMP